MNPYRAGQPTREDVLMPPIPDLTIWVMLFAAFPTGWLFGFACVLMRSW